MIRRQFLSLTVLALLAGSTTFAADKNFTGKWLYTWSTQDGTKIETTFDLKQDGEKVTGTVTGRGGMKTEITDGVVKDGELTFKVVRTREGNTFTVEYRGKLDGDNLKGKTAMEFNGQKRERDFDAKRVD